MEKFGENTVILDGVNIFKSFYQGKKEIPVLKGATLSLGKGESLAIIGKSGSGKSTLLSLLSGVDRPTSGQLKFLGKELGSLSENNVSELRASKMGIIFQQFFLIPHLTALENIQLPLQINGLNSKIHEAQNWLEKVGLGDRSNHFPDQLSGGEKQRVAIARALVHSPELILADEPSGSLDETTGNEIMDLIFNLIKEKDNGLILVTHDKELAARCNRTLVLENGVLNL